MKQAVIRLGINPASGVCWAVDAGTGPLALDNGSLAAAAARLKGMRITVLVPALDVTLRVVSLPTKNRQQLAAAVPFALEDELAEEIGQMHFAIGERLEDETLPVAVVSRAVLDGWLSLCADAGILPDILLPESLAVPWREGKWTILVDGGVAVVRTGSAGGFAVDQELLFDLLPKMGRDGAYRCDGAVLFVPANELPWAERIVAAGQGVLPVEIQQTEDPLLLLAKGALAGRGINLRQGGYSRYAGWRESWGQWRLTALLGVAAGLLFCGMQLHDWRQAVRQRDLLAAEIETVYRQAFPDAKKIVNPRVQMEQRLEELRRQGSVNENSFFTLFNRVSPILTRADGFTLLTLQYWQGGLQLDFEIASLYGLDAVKKDLAGKTGVTVEIQAATAIEGRIQARMEIREKGA